MAGNPLDTIAAAPMRLHQYVVVALCCLINAIDGFDVVSMSYAAPVLTREWTTSYATLGVVFSAASIGLACGAFLLAPLADRWGRWPVMLVALVAITISHALSAVSDTIEHLMMLRFIMGLGLGVLVVSLNVMASEYSNDRQRSMMLALLHSGFTVGMMSGGLLAALVLEPYGWRAIFVFGAIVNVVLLVLFVLLMSESPTFLLTRQPPNALVRLNAILARLGHAPLAALPPRPVAELRRGGLRALLGSEERMTSLLFWLTSLTYAVIGYFLLTWKPKVLVDAGLTPSQAGLVGASVGVMGILGHLSMGWQARKGGASGLTAIYFALCGASLLAFGNAPNAVLLIVTAGLLQFFTVGAYTGLFLTAVALYPPERRSLGIGFMVGFVRLGAIIGPFVGGILLGANQGRATTFAVFTAISAIPVIAMVLLARGTARQAATPAAAAAPD